MVAGAALAVVSGLAGALVQHLLALRSDSVIRRRNLAEKDVHELADALPGEVRAYVSTLRWTSVVPEMEEFREHVYCSLVDRLRVLLKSGKLTTV